MKKILSDFEQTVALASKRLSKTCSALEATQSLMEMGNIQGAYEAAFSFAEASEKLTLLARVLPAYTGHPQAHNSMDELILQTIPIQIGFTREGWFALRIPALLPKKAKGSTSYIRSSLHPAMRRFFVKKEPVNYPDCVLVFRHVYSRERPERQYRDHDNIELNMVTDIIALYVLTDDSALRCSHYYCSAVGNADRTEVYVVPQAAFIDWLRREKTISEEGVTLYENRPEGP